MSTSTGTRPSGRRSPDTPTSRSGAAEAARPRSRPPARDQLCAAAVDLARAAAVEVAGEAAVGPHVDVQVEGDRLLTHLFAAELVGYRGWQWAVTVTRAPRARVVTVNEVVLLPGPDAVLAPEWVPWSERVRPGDLGPGDLLPTPSGDPRLAPGYTGEDQRLRADDPGSALVAYELGLGRARVLSAEGREEAVDRWYAGDGGPGAPVAKAAPAPCSTCGFFAPLAGVLGLAFGACANDMSPSDGRVVSVDHGCGAHSEGVPVPGSVSGGPPVVDDAGYDEVVVDSGPAREDAAEAHAATGEGTEGDTAGERPGEGTVAAEGTAEGEGTAGSAGPAGDAG